MVHASRAVIVTTLILLTVVHSSVWVTTNVPRSPAIDRANSLNASQNTSPFLFDDFNGSQLSSRWTSVTYPMAANTANYSLSNSVLHMKSSGSSVYYPNGLQQPGNYLQIAAPISPGSSVSATVRVMAHSFGRFQMALTNETGLGLNVIDGRELGVNNNVAGIEFDSGTTQCGNFVWEVASNWNNDASYLCENLPSSDSHYLHTETWYRIQISLIGQYLYNTSLSQVTWTLMDDSGSVLQTQTGLTPQQLRAFTTPTFSARSIRFVTLSVWCGDSDACNSDYDVDWVSVGTARAVPGFQSVFLLNVTSVYPVATCSGCQEGAATKSREIANLARNHGYSLTIISTFDEWDRLLRQPPAGIIVFSAQWNWMLIPRSWQSVSWQDFYVYVANVIRTNGWIMHSEDWPFYGYYREGDSNMTLVGPSATNTFFSVVGASMDASTDNITPDISNITMFGRTAAAALGCFSCPVLPTAMVGPGVFNHRAVAWSGVTPFLTFYQTEPGNYGVRYPASAIRMGSGFFVHVQWNENLTLTADMIFAFTTTIRFDQAFTFDWADYDNNGVVNILDIAQVAFCYDQTGTDCALYWDWSRNGRIDIIDVATAAFQYGKALRQPVPGQGLPQGQFDSYWVFAVGCYVLPYASSEWHYCLSYLA